MSPPVLPTAIREIRVPAFFSPSRWSSAHLCPVTDWGTAIAGYLLPESPEMVFGTVVHRARQRFLCEPLGPRSQVEAMNQIFEEETTKEEARLSTEGNGAIVPLSKSVDWLRWADQRRRLQSWAEHTTAKGTLPKGGSRHRASPSSHELDSFALGVEPWWQSSALRLKGRPDEAWLSDDGSIEIVDYKTGWVFNDDGRLVKSIETQLHLYALMAEALAPGHNVRLFVQHARREPVPWNEMTRLIAQDGLRALADQFPAASVIDGVEAARPGLHCKGCRLRPSCTAYHSTAPAWWHNKSTSPRPLPLDVWGHIDRIEQDKVGVTVSLEDAAGRRVRIEGLAEDRRLIDVDRGDELFFFGLQPTEDTFRHSSKIHPVNFHERSPGKPWPEALQTRVFKVGA